jgi:hypothetical protein
MSTQDAVTEARAALREFLAEHLSEAEVRQASKLVVAYVVAAVNDRPRMIRERQEAEARRAQAIQDAKDHHARTTGIFGRGAGDGLQESLDRLSTLTAELHRRRPSGQPVGGSTQGGA